MEKAVGSSSKINKGAAFSFISILFEILVSFFLLKYLTKELGSNYGIYSLALSVIGIFLVDFGLSQSATRFISKYRINNDTQKENEFLGILLRIYLIIDIAIFLFAFVAYFFLPSIYSGLSPSELDDFKVVYIIVAIYSCISFPLLPLNGILSGHEEFSIIKILSMVQKLLTAILLALSLILELGLYAVVFANVSSAIIVGIIKLIITHKRCNIRPNLKIRNRPLVKEILTFTVWIAVSSIAARLSLSFMSTILASVANSTAIAVFGIAVTLETYIYAFSTAVSGLFLPKVTQLTHDNNQQSLNSLSIKVGKFQLFVSGLFLCGFILFGKEFLALYLQPIYSASYWPTVLLFLCVLFSAPLLIPQTISYATGTIKQVSLIELAVALVRLGMCWFFAKIGGVIGLSIAYTAGSFIISALKLYFVYYKKQNLDIKRFLLETCLKFLVPLVLSVLIGVLFKKAIETWNWVLFILYCVGFTFLFTALSAMLYFSKNERDFYFEKIVKLLPPIKKLLPLFNKRETDNRVPIVICFVLVVLSFFTSNYPITSVSLIALIAFFLLSLSCYVYYVFPARKYKNYYYFRYLLKSSGFLFLFFFSICAVLTFFVTKSYVAVFGILKFLLVLWAAFLFTEVFSLRTFVRYFKNTFFVICLLSLFFSAIILLFNTNFSPIITDGSYYNYFYVFFAIAGTDILGSNCGIFWEPGIFASFCCIALIIQILFDNSNWKKQLSYYVVFVISLISTGSLAGYILSIILIPLFMNKFKNKACKAISHIVLMVFIMALLLFVPFFDIVSDLFPVFLEKGQSLTTRLFALEVDLKIYASSPIFGVGDNYQSMFQSISMSEYPGLLDTSLNTFGYYLGFFGIGGILFILSFLSSIILLKKAPKMVRIVLLIFGILVFSKEPHTLSLLSMILFFYLLKGSDVFNFSEIRSNSISYSLYYGKGKAA